jgi:hypothetical protein
MGQIDAVEQGGQLLGPHEEAGGSRLRLGPGEAAFLKPFGADPQALFMMPHSAMLLINLGYLVWHSVSWGENQRRYPSV